MTAYVHIVVWGMKYFLPILLSAALMGCAHRPKPVIAPAAVSTVGIQEALASSKSQLEGAIKSNETLGASTDKALLLNLSALDQIKLALELLNQAENE